MRNEELGMRSAREPFRGEGLPQDKEIASAQVLFPDRKTLDEVIAEYGEMIEMLQSEIEALKETITEEE